MADSYCKGIVRNHVESTNLRARHADNQVTRAEFFSTAAPQAFFGKPYVDMVQRLNDRMQPSAQGYCLEIDWRNPRRRKITTRDTALLYGQRPNNSEVWHFSPYEFVMYWSVQLLSYPRSLADLRLHDHHADLTDAGMQRLSSKLPWEELIPGVDYAVKEGGLDWLPYPNVPACKRFRHKWIMVRRRRPVVPSFAGSPLPSHRPEEEARAASIVMS